MLQGQATSGRENFMIRWMSGCL